MSKTNNSNFIAFIIFLVSLTIFATFTKGTIEQNVYLGDTKSQLNVKLADKKVQLGNLEEIQKAYTKNLTDFNDYINKIREDSVIDMLYEMKEGISIKNIGISKGKKTLSGMNKGTLTVGVTFDSLSTLKRYISYLTTRANVTIDKFSFAYNTLDKDQKENISYSTNLNLGIYYLK